MPLKECSLSQFLGGSFDFLVLFLLYTHLKSFGLEGRMHSAVTAASGRQLGCDVPTWVGLLVMPATAL